MTQRRPKSEKRQRNKVVSVRMTEAELARVMARSYVERRSVAAVLRDAGRFPRPPRRSAVMRTGINSTQNASPTSAGRVSLRITTTWAPMCIANR